MATVVRMPQLGESVVEGTILHWLKRPGERVAKHEPLLTISTDKIDTEVPAPVDGVLLEVTTPEGATVRAGTVIATIGAAGESPSIATAPTTTAVTTPAVAPPQNSPPQSSSQQSSSLQSSSPEMLRSDARPTGRAFISPVVARMSAEHSVDLAQVPGTGLGGRITRKDLEAYLAGVRQEITEGAEGAAAVTPAPAPRLDAEDVLEPLSTMRRAIAQHMALSKRTSPHVTTIVEADMTAVVRHRDANKDAFAHRGAPLTYTAYFVAASLAGLRAVPAVNSTFTEAGIVLHRRLHVGVAVALPAGLVVPVIRDADALSLAGLARALDELVQRARVGRLSPDDLQGGTFTLTNHGTGGSLVGTPIINQPQSAILGVGAIVKRPVVRSSRASLLPSADDAIVIRPMVYLSLTFDHRVLDGAQADRFLTAVKEKLENWKD